MRQKRAGRRNDKVDSAKCEVPPSPKATAAGDGVRRENHDDTTVHDVLRTGVATRRRDRHQGAKARRNTKDKVQICQFADVQMEGKVFAFVETHCFASLAQSRINKSTNQQIS